MSGNQGGMRHTEPATAKPGTAMTTPKEIAAYAAYANHQAIQKKPVLTFHSWKRAGKP